MLGTIRPTRGELIRTRKRIILAKRGHELLKKKQDSLIIEFFKIIKDVRTHQHALHEEYTSAVLRMNRARALESDLRIRSAALAVQETAPVEIRIRNIAGVKMPTIERVETARDKPLYDSLMLQEVGGAYNGVLEHIMALAAKETALRKLLVEIRKTKRRAHALEHILIPELNAARAHIQFELEERSREEFTRLKRKKAMT